MPTVQARASQLLSATATASCPSDLPGHFQQRNHDDAGHIGSAGAVHRLAIEEHQRVCVVVDRHLGRLVDQPGQPGLSLQAPCLDFYVLNHIISLCLSTIPPPRKSAGTSWPKEGAT